SQTKKKQIISEHQEEALTDAIKIYQEEQQKPEEERRSLRTICQEVEGRWRKKVGYAAVNVSRETVRRRLNGGRSCHQFNMETNARLTTEEEEQIIMFSIDLAARGFPLNHRSLKVHVDSV
ncbi:hypothetical protein BU15DRAFT_30365, partial [Melanogaster broomeanus]